MRVVNPHRGRDHARMAGELQRHVLVIVRGVVQGVWYRKSTVDAAERIGGLRGTVRNLPDRSVEIEARGAPDAVDALLRWAEQGPPAARVDDLEITELDHGQDPGPFRVVY
jgi:acylphosphatase